MEERVHSNQTQTRMKTHVRSFTHESHPALFLAAPLSGSDLHHSMNKAAERGGKVGRGERGERGKGGGDGGGDGRAGDGCGEKGETLVNPEK